MERPAGRTSINRAILRALPAKLLDGRPPALLRSGEKTKSLKDPLGLKSKKSKRYDRYDAQNQEVIDQRALKSEGPVRSAAPQDAEGPRALCQAARKCHDDVKAQSLLRQAAASVHPGTTIADCTFVLKTIADFTSAKPKQPQRLDEAAIRYLAETLSQRHSSSSELYLDSRNLSLAASSLAKSRVWVQAFGILIQQFFNDEAPNNLRAFNPTDIAQLCHFMAVFREKMDAKPGSVWAAGHLQLQNHEQQGRRLQATGLVSLLRSLTLSKDKLQKSELNTFGTWLRARLVDEIGSCSPRQLASAVLDMGALDLLDVGAVRHLQREITRAATSKEMRARDLASILVGYSKFPAPLPERQILMAPLLPKMVTLMPNCSLGDMCELLHGLASAHISDRILLEAWSSNFTLKATSVTSLVGAWREDSARNGKHEALSPTQLSLAVADLAKLRFIRKDPYAVFSTLLHAVSDVSPSLGGLAVCHVVCAMARVKSGRTDKNFLMSESEEDDFRRRLLCRLEAQLLTRLEELQPQGLSASAAAFVKLSHFSKELFNGLASASVPCLDSFSAKDFAMMSSALCAAQHIANCWSGSPLEQLGQKAARSLTQGTWTPRQVAQVLQPFALQPLPEGLLNAAVKHLRSHTSNYSPRDIVGFLSGLRSALGDKALVENLWNTSRLRLHTRGTQTIATAQSLVQLRSVIPLSKLRYRFRLLSRDLQRTLRIRPVPYEEQAWALRIWALLGLRDWPLLAKLASNLVEALDAEAARAFADGANVSSLIHPQDLAQAIYAFAKLGAPELVPEAFRPPISQVLVRSMKATCGFCGFTRSDLFLQPALERRPQILLQGMYI
ncbi:unnamed protein product [Cladocopium goreaui]|uniref:Uncharacterized protein n=1 Tax=Cladocopium goreaui TaxID=2562237 RepID=A0A9P1FR83_9DINO|nr:unnamed protein product [Cladocopium goreaui]